MPETHFISAHDAARLIDDGATVSVSSSSGLGCPDAVLQAIGERFATAGQPRGLTAIHPIAAGDMFGIAGVDHLAEEGLLRRVIAGSFPSGPSSLPSPKIWRLITENRIEAYNLPSGILFHLHREAASARPGILTQVGIDTFVDPRRNGGRMNEVTREEIVSVVEFDDREWLYVRSMPIDVAIVRGTTADTLGNITMEHEAAFLGVLDQAMAAHNCGGIVIAQVERTTEHGLSPQQVRIPGVFVDYVVVAPEQQQTTQTGYDAVFSGESRKDWSTIEPVEWGLDKIIARRAALELRDHDAVNIGFGISAVVPRILLEEGMADTVTWVIEQGAMGGAPALGFQFGCAVNPQAIVPSPDLFTYFHGGGLDRSFLSFLQVDGEGNVNVSRLSSRPHVTAGVGGFADIVSRARQIVFSGHFRTASAQIEIESGEIIIRRDGAIAKFVDAVEHVTFSGRRARQLGQRVLYVTERCVISLETEGLTVVEIAPGIDLERDILQQADCPLRIHPDLRLMDPLLFVSEPMRLRLKASRDDRAPLGERWETPCERVV
jgi:propionate CoA-transferase